MSTPKGFRFAGVHSGIKAFRKDLALVVSDRPCVAVAALTVNAAAAAPIIDCRNRLPSNQIQAVLINSGNANALTGPEGLDDVKRLCHATALALQLSPEAVIMASTGVIGHRLPLAKIEQALPQLVSTLGYEATAAAEAILTTDTFAKRAHRRFKVGECEVTLSGICKGSGMIAPQLASTIGLLTTDLAIAPALLQQALTRAVNKSFNALTVDNDMSTNDAVVLLANGAAGNVKLDTASADFEPFCEALESLCTELAKSVAKDGEGATRLVEVTVSNATDEVLAFDIAKAVAGSMLVKAALFGGDPNWGRILATVGARVGSLKAPVDVSQARLSIQGVAVYDTRPLLSVAPVLGSNGANESASAPGHAELKSKMRRPEVFIDIDLRAGAARATAWGCDLSYDYVKINADYTSLLVPRADGSMSKDDRLTNYSPQFKKTLVTQALRYIARFQGKRVVVKVGLTALNQPSVVEDIHLLTQAGMVPVVVLAHAPEKQAQETLLNQLNQSGTSAIGLSGLDASFLLQTEASGDSEFSDFDSLQVKAEVLEMMLSRQHVPVIAPVGMRASGETTAWDADLVAAAVAVACRATKLVYLTNRPGFVEGEVLLSQVSAASLRDRLDAGQFDSASAHKARCSLYALQNGVGAIHLVDARMPHAMVAEFFTDEGVGSLVTAAAEPK